MARKLEVQIVGDASSLSRALGKASDESGRFGSALKSTAKYAGLAIGGIAVTLKAGIGEFTQATKVAAQTGAVLKSTGGAANVTAKEVSGLAEAIMKKTGIDDEAIQSGQNLLLTFKNIKNEAGRGNDIFNQTTRIMADMSTALGTDASGSAIKLGKALNDPVKGISALTRVGVSFTEGQKEQIKQMVAAGDTMGAQKMILKELNSEFGGSAEAVGKTLPGQINILKESFNNMAGDLVSKAMPAVTGFVGFLNEKGVPALGAAFGKIGEVVGPAIAGLGDAFKAAGPAIMGVLEPLGGVIRENLVPILLQLQEIGTKAITQISDIIRQNGPQLRTIFENIGTVITNLAKIVIPLLEFAFTKVLPVAIRILIPLLVLVSGAIAKVSDVVRIVANVIQSVMIPAMQLILTVGQKVADFLLKILIGAFKAVEDPVRTVANVLKVVLAGAFDVVSGAAGKVRDGFEWFSNKAQGIFKRLSQVLPGVLDVITAPFSTLNGVIWGIIGGFKRFVDLAGSVIEVAGKVGGALGGIAGKIPGFAGGIRNFGGGLAIVGESGPELVRLPAGSDVIPNHQLGSAMGSPRAVGGGGQVNIYLPNYLGAAEDVARTVREEMLRIGKYNVDIFGGRA
jgi:hypothetical protein